MAAGLPERPRAEDVLAGLDHGRRRASFRIHLGYAAGLGATTHMLDEARRRRSRGTDVVVGAVR
ncbi:MAG: histidine kinase, partial [Candidatus Dormibacteraeota bacterium]|nr:histidine kinase [Candidatus Dormibacteraeota bacterium]